VFSDFAIKEMTSWRYCTT